MSTDTEESQDSSMKLEEEIKKFRVAKAKAKTAFTKQKNSFVQCVGGNSPVEQLIQSQKKLDELAEKVMDILTELIRIMEMKDSAQVDGLIDEMSAFEQEYSRVQTLQVSPQIIKMDTAVAVDNSVKTSQNLGQDMWKQLSRVNIPSFGGNKSSYDSWKAAFTACVDNAPATAEYKLLQLRQSLTGDALKAVENLGHSPEAYEVAKERLERKFGGERRQIALHLEELGNIKPIRQDNFRDLEKFADTLDLAVVNLKQTGKEEELGGGYLYSHLMKKMNEPLLAQFQRWLSEHQKSGTDITLREFVIQEAEFQIVAAETINGVGQNKNHHSKATGQRAYFSGGKNSQNRASFAAVHMGSGTARNFKMQM